MQDDFSIEQYFKLSGLEGLYGLKRNPKIFDTRNIISDGTVVNFEDRELKLKIKINNSKLMHVVEFENKLNQPDLLITLLKPMIKNATKLGFERLKFTAEGDYVLLKHANVTTYIEIGKYGFQMSSKVHREFLKDLAKANPLINVKNIYELLQTKEGLEIWAKIGIRWVGTFYLSGEKNCHELFKQATKS